MVTIFILLSENNRLDMNKLEKVFKEETLDGVKINTISTLNFSIKFIQAVNYWNFEILKAVYSTDSVIGGGDILMEISNE